MKTSFTNTLPDKDFIWVIPYSQGMVPSCTPKSVQDFLKRKNPDQIIEFFTEKNQFILVPLDGCSKKNREEVGANIFKHLSKNTESMLLLDCRELNELGLDLLTGFLLFSWSFDKYKTDKKIINKKSVEEIIFFSHHPKKIEEAFLLRRPFIEGVFLAKALTSEPPNVFFPNAYAQSLKNLESLGISVEILDQEELKKIGMTALLAAGQGSIHPPAVAILTWNGLDEPSKNPIVVIGKGVCFDSGGLCLKSPLHQIEMKWDKAGGGVVAGFIKAIALAKLPCHVIGIIGLVENMPDGGAVKPGDVIETMSGKTIEIVDTDAEGRLVLADCLWYAQERFHPKMMIDLGTLTIETFAALGKAYAGLYANDKNLLNSLKKAGEESGDCLWELPMGPFFAKQIESSIADIKNVGIDFCGENGAAAEFLKCFVKDIPWAHIDISGVSWSKEDLVLSQQGVTGFGVRLLYEWIQEELKKNRK